MKQTISGIFSSILVAIIGLFIEYNFFQTSSDTLAERNTNMIVVHDSSLTIKSSRTLNNYDSIQNLKSSTKLKYTTIDMNGNERCTVSTDGVLRVIYGFINSKGEWASYTSFEAHISDIGKFELTPFRFGLIIHFYNDIPPKEFTTNFTFDEYEFSMFVKQEVKKFNPDIFIKRTKNYRAITWDISKWLFIGLVLFLFIKSIIEENKGKN